MPFHAFLRLAYAGTHFHGWQIQSQARSVQKEVWDALRRLDPEIPLPQGTGRTDAGVHARAQGVLVQLTREWEPFRLLSAINAHLPLDVRVMAARAVDPRFFPRHHALAKRYLYRISEGPAEDPFSREFRWHLHGASPLDAEGMARAAASLVGTHDFSSFRHKECSASTPIRHLYKAEVLRKGSEIDLVFEGNRFLMHQVRIMTGTLVEIGRGRIPEASLPDILAALDRAKAGRTAPPHGLCLEEVWYQSQWKVGEPCPWGDETRPDP